MNNRVQLLQELLDLRRPATLISAELAKFPWDSATELAILQRSHLKAVLGNFIAGRLTIAEVQSWAEAVEKRDDIGLEPGHEEQLKSLVFALATPEIHRPLNPALAALFIEDLGKPRPPGMNDLVPCMEFEVGPLRLAVSGRRFPNSKTDWDADRLIVEAVCVGTSGL